jgi:hypothetical protein
MSSFGPGAKRAVMLQSLFAASPLSIGDLCDLQQKLESESDRRGAASGITNAIANLKDLGSLDLDRFKSLGTSGKDMLVSGLSCKVSAVRYRNGNVAQAFRDVMQITKELDSDGTMGTSLTRDLIAGVSHESPFEVWDVLHSPGEPEMDTSLQVLVANRMASSDVSKAMSMVVENGSVAGTGPVFAYWLQFDPKEASAWFDSHNKNLSAGMRDQISGTFANDSVGNGKVTQAWEYTNQINDPEQRRITEGQVWSAERNIVRREANANPEEAIQSMLYGVSEHADYWLQKALTTWIAKNPDMAEEWQRTHLNTLPKGKAQYVAAAYANEAIKQGDAATARQWAGLIQNPKTKLRIETAIQKAEENKVQ